MSTPAKDDPLNRDDAASADARTVPDLPLPFPLLIAHAPRRDRAWHALCWRIDGLMARTVLGAKEGAMAAIRLAWWEEALTGAHSAPNDPLLQEWLAFSPGIHAGDCVGRVAEAWRMLLDPAPMSEADWRRFGEGRGRLFTLIARSGEGNDVLNGAGKVWALWDMARRDPDRARAEGAFAAAIEMAGTIEDGILSRMRPKPLMLAAGMALDDVRACHLPAADFSLRQYLRLLRRAIFG
ncbi:MAG TPA: hypothetical protein VF503_25650 [Sphingobium sp.]|uniref:hypothetical protein n=1 Tax=Sphingobium sp. TaxID=1912891 RepID=UPI002ED56F81